jgi:hypothetical protein
VVVGLRKARRPVGAPAYRARGVGLIATRCTSGRPAVHPARHPRAFSSRSRCMHGSTLGVRSGGAGRGVSCQSWSRLNSSGSTRGSLCLELWCNPRLLKANLDRPPRSSAPTSGLGWTSFVEAFAAGSSPFADGLPWRPTRAAYASRTSTRAAMSTCHTRFASLAPLTSSRAMAPMASCTPLTAAGIGTAIHAARSNFCRCCSYSASDMSPSVTARRKNLRRSRYSSIGEAGRECCLCVCAQVEPQAIHQEFLSHPSPAALWP